MNLRLHTADAPDKRQQKDHCEHRGNGGENCGDKVLWNDVGVDHVHAGDLTSDGQEDEERTEDSGGCGADAMPKKNGEDAPFGAAHQGHRGQQNEAGQGLLRSVDSRGIAEEMQCVEDLSREEGQHQDGEGSRGYIRNPDGDSVLNPDKNDGNSEQQKTACGLGRGSAGERVSCAQIAGKERVDSKGDVEGEFEENSRTE